MPIRITLGGWQVQSSLQMLVLALLTIVVVLPITYVAQARTAINVEEVLNKCRPSWLSPSIPAVCEWKPSLPLPTARAYAAAVATSPSVFVAGGFRWDAGANKVIYYDDVLAASIQNDGSLGQWSQVAQLPSGRSGLGMAAAGECLFIVGGTWSDDKGAVYTGDVHSGHFTDAGKVPDFRKSPNSLHIPRSNHTLLAYEGNLGRYLYAVAGVTQMDKDTVHLDTIEYAAIGERCEVGPWSISHFDVKGGRSSPQAVLVNEHIYVVGGWGDLDLVDVYNDVQYTRIREDGALSPWQTSAYRLPTGLYGHTTSIIPLASPGGTMFLVTGGQPSTGVYSGTIAYAYMMPHQLPTHSVGPWTLFYKVLPKERAGHAAVYTLGRLYLIGGSQPGGVYLDEVIFTEIVPGVPE